MAAMARWYGCLCHTLEVNPCPAKFDSLSFRSFLNPTVGSWGGSHHVFTKPGERPIVIPVHRNKVKPFYVREIQKHIRPDERPKGS